MTPRLKFKTQTFLVVCDNLILEMENRFLIYNTIYNEFSVLFDFNNEDIDKKRNAAKFLVNKYTDDLEEEFENELLHFHEHLKLELSGREGSGKKSEAFICI